MAVTAAISALSVLAAACSGGDGPDAQQSTTAAIAPAGTTALPVSSTVAPITAVPTTVAPAPTTVATPKNFAVNGTQIIDPDGKVFYPVGANFNGPDWVWPFATAGLADTAKNVWKWNIARLDSCLPIGCDVPDKAHSTVNNDLDGLVKEFTDRKMVVLIVLNQVRSGTFPSAQRFADIQQWWSDVATRFKDNPYVWFGPLAENGNSLNAQAQPVIDQWFDLHAQLIQTIRATGAKNPIVVNGTQWGQEVNLNTVNPVPDSGSAILTRGPELLAIDPNIIFDLHVYDQWGGLNSDAARDARLRNFFERVQEKNMAMIIAETGGYSAQDGTSSGSDLARLLARATKSAYRVAPSMGIGIIAWHAQPGDGFALTIPGSFTTLGNNDAPTTLSWHGRLMWDLTRNPPV
ncbi:MAG: cellulase family glycosylhydrolase [Acidimicrobiia bacterium]